MIEIANTYHVPVPNLPLRREHQPASLLAVLVQDHAGGYACYTGIVPLPCPSSGGYSGARLEAARQIAASGMKCSLKLAQAFFPAMSAENYRA